MARYTGPAPFGFSWEGDALVPDEKEAAVRRLAFELFGENPRKGTVAKLLNEAGHTTRKGGKWRDVTVARLLTCSSAIGDYAVNKTKKGQDGKRVDLPPEEWVRIPCEPIIDRSLWDDVVEALGGATPAAKEPVSRPAKSPFVELVHCGCGTSMVLENAATKYVCRECGRRIPAEDLEAIILDEVREYLVNREDLLKMLIEVPERLRESEESLWEHLAALRKVEEDMSKIHQLYMANQITVERFGELHGPLEEDRDRLRKQTPQLEREVGLAKQESVEEVAEISVSGLLDTWSELPLDTRKTILKTLFDRVIVGDGEIEFEGQFPQTPLRTPTSQQTERPTNGPLPTSADEPEYIRLPKAKERCPRSGLTRSYLNELILPTERNGYQPPVKSKSIRRTGNMRGVRLILWESLKSYLNNQEIEGE